MSELRFGLNTPSEIAQHLYPQRWWLTGGKVFLYEDESIMCFNTKS